MILYTFINMEKSDIWIGWKTEKEKEKKTQISENTAAPILLENKAFFSFLDKKCFKRRWYKYSGVPGQRGKNQREDRGKW